MEANAEHDFCLIWLTVVPCASDFKNEKCDSLRYKIVCLVHETYTTYLFRNIILILLLCGWKVHNIKKFKKF